MASILSTSIRKVNTIGHLTQLCKIPKTYNVTQLAFMKRLALMEQMPKPPPYPYWKKLCTEMDMIFDPLSLRFDDNSRLIVVEGPPAVGKTKLCKEIAREFGLLYMPPPIHDEMFINPYGFDIRSLDPKVPDSCKSFDLNDFLKEPVHERTSVFQLQYLAMRLDQYMNSLLHILASGQGVVLNRCIFTEIAFEQAMYNAGYISKNALNDFEEMKASAYNHLLKPHLFIYLDASVDVTLEKIKQRGNINEINSKVFTAEYLSDLENITKQNYSNWLSNHSEIVIYDWNKEGNIMDIIYDIENMNLESDVQKDKFFDWVFPSSDNVIYYLELYQNKYVIFNETLCVGITANELYYLTHETSTYFKEIEKVDSEKYIYGYNPKYDKIPWIERPGVSLSFCRRTPRDFVNCDYFDYFKL